MDDDVDDIEMLHLHLDLTRVKFVVQTLMSNALKYTRRRGKTVVTVDFLPPAAPGRKLDTWTSRSVCKVLSSTKTCPETDEDSSSCDAGFVRISVADDGCGIYKVHIVCI